MNSEQVAGILRQCPRQIRLVIARTVREPAETTTNRSLLRSKDMSMASESFIRTTDDNNHNSSTAMPSSLMMSDNDTAIKGSPNQILLRTEHLLENNQNIDKILGNLHEQVRIYWHC